MKQLNFLLIFFLVLIGAVFFFSTAFAETISTIVNIKPSECSDGVDNDGDLRIDFPNDPECASSLDDSENIAGVETSATTTLIISGDAFSHTNSDGLNVDFEFPSDFNTTSTRLLVNTYSNGFFKSSKPALTGYQFIGKTYDFILYQESDGQEITVLNEKISITLRYLTSDVKAGTDEETYIPYKWNDTNSSWDKISDFTLSPSANEINFSTNYFGSFSILGTGRSEDEGEGETVPTAGSAGTSLYFRREPSLKEEKKALRRADLNGDGYVNLVDLSILLYYAERPMEEAGFADLNNDNRIDIQDISIMLFYWV